MYTKTGSPFVFLGGPSVSSSILLKRPPPPFVGVPMCRWVRRCEVMQRWFGRIVQSKTNCADWTKQD